MKYCVNYQIDEVYIGFWLTMRQRWIYSNQKGKITDFAGSLVCS